MLEAAKAGNPLVNGLFKYLSGRIHNQWFLVISSSYPLVKFMSLIYIPPSNGDSPIAAEPWHPGTLDLLPRKIPNQIPGTLW